MNRGLMVVNAGVSILGPDKIDNDTTCRLAVLGWTIEWLQAWLLVADDIMDSSVTRRGQPCWYKTLGDAWYIAINDAVTIESLVYKIIKRHFRTILPSFAIVGSHDGNDASNGIGTTFRYTL